MAWLRKLFNRPRLMYFKSFESGCVTALSQDYTNKFKEFVNLNHTHRFNEMFVEKKKNHLYFHIRYNDSGNIKRETKYRQQSKINE